MLDGEVELDDFYIGARRGGVGRGTEKHPMVCCAERGEEAVCACGVRIGGRRGRCALRVVEDMSGGTYRVFSHDHVNPSASVHADGWTGIAAGLSGYGGLDQRSFDASDPEASLPVVHHAISNFKSLVQGTFHGLAAGSLQAAADDYSWRYSHRDSRDILADLLDDIVARWRSREELRDRTFLTQPTKLSGRAA